ncbi:DsbA family oxidoreductase [Niallia taxi]|uniref:DsbA family oxidoreductase n=1 Tax=Niallia taxi TaxID=2499688 RepID=A0A437KCD5_9BACI|nr:DsbA family oxidoreductase [Niallia taxi]MCM3217637.1 DsbA family oxidoreductase [Niallia taxi]MDK8640359.1 DsbA family oxidoreductase [Niallia taxi]MED4054947.1 DsbA family oxidoreductase [Niallia taxi]MED4121041.1 DsbA family oxidoreductase [Niallia taxi]RVT63706.1 DsbA family oxidoreductase [Niallia taxi]
MKIEVWSDFVCPFCYIGKRRLEEAIAQFPGKDQVEVEFKSFELDPNAQTYSGTGINEALAKKYGMSIEEAKRANEGIGSQAAEVGLTFNFDEMKPTNTFDAHRLAKFAATVGKEKEMTEKLLASYFTESKLISDHDVLVEIAQTAGIEKEETLAVLNDSTKYANDVRIDEALAQQMGVTGVPFFVINQKYSISGAQPTETFRRALQQVWEEEGNAPKLQDLSGGNTAAACTDDNCEIPGK